MSHHKLEAGQAGPSFTVNDLERSMRFSTDGLGFVVSERWEENGQLQGVMLKAGSAMIGLTQDDFKKGRDRVKGVGMSYYIETDQDIAALGAEAAKAGVTFDMGPGPMPWGPMGFQVTDPDGFKVMVSNRG